jgi:IclR family transcriptional regulator, pca regulon regulatory protein
VLLANLPAPDIEDYLTTYELTPFTPQTITDEAEFRAELRKVREDGYALVSQELEDGLVAVAVPVRDRMGRARAAINLSTHVGRRSVEEMRALVPVVKEAAAEIELGLSHSLNWAD